jgi:hypothetical protein
VRGGDATMDKKADNKTVEKTIEALKSRNINAIFVETAEEAKKKVLEIIPKGAEVMTMTSVTLSSLGLPEIINESGDYDAVKPKLNKLDRKTQSLEMQKLGAAPEWSIGSVHAVTEEGNVVIASNTGSQLPGYVYGSQHVIWVVGTQKIVKDLDTAMKRIYEYILPLESVRLNKQYNITIGSNVSKIAIVNKEVNPQRVTLIFVDEVLGF